MKTDRIREIVESILSHDGSDAEPDARVAAEKARHPEFAERYPTLLEMACRASAAGSDPSDAENVRTFLGLMLAQLKNVRKVPKAAAAQREAALHDASVQVGKALADAYLPPPNTAS